MPYGIQAELSLIQSSVSVEWRVEQKKKKNYETSKIILHRLCKIKITRFKLKFNTIRLKVSQYSHPARVFHVIAESSDMPRKL